MGKGDKKSRKGKISIGSYGNSRKRKKVKSKVSSKPAKAAAAEATTEQKPKRTTRKKADA